MNTRTLPTVVALAVVTAALSASAAEFHVSASGTPAGDGSLGSPWDLKTALAQPASVQPGDTIWLGGGTYAGAFASTLTGTAAAPITVRSTPGQWARIDLPAGTSPTDAWLLEGAWTVYRDFEVLCSGAAADRPNAAIQGHDLKVVDVVVHDLGNTMLHGNGNEVAGCIFYNNGVDGGDLAHHLYTQNDDLTRPTRIVDSILFDSYSFGIHAYATQGYLLGIQIIGNVLFNAGVAHTIGSRKDNCLVGSVTNPPAGIVLRENMGWAAHPGDRSLALGRYNSNNVDITLENNFLVGATEFTNPWQSVTMTGNTFYGTVSGSVATTDYPSNTYLSAAPATTTVLVRKNPYDANRAHIVVYNWSLLDTVDVDVSTVLAPGSTYEVRNGQNYFAAPVASGTYSGGTIALPMSAGSDPATPIGPGLIESGEQTGKQLNVFVLLANGAGVGDGGTVTGDAAVGSGPAPAADAGGCGCRTAVRGSSSAASALLMGLLLLVRRGRRRRGCGAESSNERLRLVFYPSW